MEDCRFTDAAGAGDELQTSDCQYAAATTWDVSVGILKMESCPKGRVPFHDSEMKLVVSAAYWNSSVAKQAPRFILLIRLPRLPKLLETEPSFEEQQLGLPLEIQISLKAVAKRLPKYGPFSGFPRISSDSLGLALFRYIRFGDCDCRSGVALQAAYIQGLRHKKALNCLSLGL